MTKGADDGTFLQESAQEMESDSVNTHDFHKKIRAILEKANHPNTPQTEAETALGLAFRLMQKHNISEDDLAAGTCRGSAAMEMIVVNIVGPYRVRRSSLFFVIASNTNCATFRDMRSGNHDVVTQVAYGARDDLFALQSLYTAAELLALRLLPGGDRRFRTSWWHGFSEGVSKKLAAEKRLIVRESPGAGLVLLERTERAEREMRIAAPRLSSSTGSFVNDGDAYAAGKAAGSQFSAGRNGVKGFRGQLGSGHSG